MARLRNADLQSPHYGSQSPWPVQRQSLHFPRWAMYQVPRALAATVQGSRAHPHLRVGRLALQQAPRTPTHSTCPALQPRLPNGYGYSTKYEYTDGYRSPIQTHPSTLQASKHDGTRTSMGGCPSSPKGKGARGGRIFLPCQVPISGKPRDGKNGVTVPGTWALLFRHGEGGHVCVAMQPKPARYSRETVHVSGMAPTWDLPLSLTVGTAYRITTLCVLRNALHAPPTIFPYRWMDAQRLASGWQRAMVHCNIHCRNRPCALCIEPVWLIIAIVMTCRETTQVAGQQHPRLGPRARARALTCSSAPLSDLGSTPANQHESIILF
ncbi:hypothetical protein LX32DRAFT_293448 [Colletotrichum zoysiae]|uniref:Uncharacterized protein n=1 Tax=Colletotrichum zoysiae TaxID=1216348 RepID=A0AAD9HL34_9PEZI|nr:hypothetical protein LX32DRAFT_293448 [Colletotrichum zoysiae]